MSSLQWPWLLAERVTPTLSSCLGWGPLDFPSDLVHWTTLRRQLSKAQVTHMVLAKFWGAEVRKLLGGKLLFRDRRRCDWLLAPALLWQKWQQGSFSTTHWEVGWVTDGFGDCKHTSGFIFPYQHISHWPLPILNFPQKRQIQLPLP